MPWSIIVSVLLGVPALLTSAGWYMATQHAQLAVVTAELEKHEATTSKAQQDTADLSNRIARIEAQLNFIISTNYPSPDMTHAR